MAVLGFSNALWVFSLLLLQASFITGLAVNAFHLCFPTMTRHLALDELYTFEKLTNHYLRSEDVSSPSAYFMAQAFVPYHEVKVNAATGTWYTIQDTAATSTPFRHDACMTVTLEISAHDMETLSHIWLDPQSNAVYTSLLRLGMAADLWIPSDSLSTTIVTTTSETGDDQVMTTTTTTTTTVASRNGTWIWTIAAVLLVGSLVIVVVWHIYLRPSPLRYIRKNESQDGTTDQNNHWPDHGGGAESAANDDDVESSCISFCTSS
eukprot:scaffold1001_cov169-Amphora_coffeaeformis.AAC.13